MKKQNATDQKKLIAQLSAIVAKAEKLVVGTGKGSAKKTKTVSKKAAKKAAPKKKAAKPAKRR